MRRIPARFAAAMVLPVMLLLAACPKDKTAKRDTMPVDTTHLDTTQTTDLSSIHSNLPPAEPDTFKPRKLTPPANTGGGESMSVPAAPAALTEAVQREQSMTKFCYTEYGQKSDPTLRGNVAMVVTVGAEGITNATVGDARWSGSAGKAVNSCLNQKAKLAWKLAPGTVKAGKYVVQLSFSGA
ncbi:MAG: hypothetical protein ACJ79K_16470 [Gemmatimonadaceae bacterium]